MLCKYGWMLFNGPYIGKCFELYGQYSEAEIRIMRSFLHAGDTGLDIGANIGGLTLPMARLVGETGRILAAESHAEHFNVLCANLALNEIRHVSPINAFIADTDAVDTAGQWGRYGYVSEHFKPPVVAVDSLGLDSCALIKIDVDGKELEVLRSAEATIARLRPVIYLENDLQEKSPLLLDHLMQRDYTLFWHQAPLFDAENFFGNAVNHWAPKIMVSLMMLCIPNEKAAQLSVNLRQVTNREEWWL